MRQIYLDFNATTPTAPSVQEAMLPFLAEHYGNPSSTHSLGRACQEAMEDARGQVAALIACDREEIYFTSGGTESNNLALCGVMLRDAPALSGHLIISAIEHPSVTEPARFLERMGYDLTVVPCNRRGVVEPERLEEACRADTRLVSVMHANNETGVIQPIREIADICQARDIVLHTDASQSVGKIHAFVDELGVDLLTITGHKLYAPKGIGALFVRRGTAIEPFLRGAGHEAGLRPGTENVAYIMGLGQAASLASKGMDDAGERLAMLRDRLYATLASTIGERLTVNGKKAARLPNTLSVNFPDVVGGELLARLPDLCASTGSACHSGMTQMSPTLACMGLSHAVARGTIRLSCGWYTSEEDIDRAASLLLGAWEDLRP